MVDRGIGRAKCATFAFRGTTNGGNSTVTHIQLDGGNDAKCTVEFLERSIAPEYDDDETDVVLILQEERYELVSVATIL